MPPSFDSKEYWSNRFATETEFEWLVEPEQLVATILEVLQQLELDKNNVEQQETLEDTQVKPESTDVGLNVLHIGCGSSKWVFHLLQNASIRKLLGNGTVVNVDYAAEAIELGRREETKFRDKLKGEGGILEGPKIRWVTTDLLNFRDAKHLKEHSSEMVNRSFDLILDKSTCDVICCGPDVELQIPCSGEVSGSASIKRPPLNVLAYNLAAITRPGAIWVVVSYSAERFPFSEKLHPEQIVASPSPKTPSQLQSLDVATFWTMIKKAEVGVDPMEVQGGPATVHRPKVSLWLYLLRRSDVPAL